jgi:hypothetical protein
VQHSRVLVIFAETRITGLTRCGVLVRLSE